MIPTGELVKVSFYIIDLPVMSVPPLSPPLSVSLSTQLVSGDGFSHLPHMPHSLRSRNGALDSHPASLVPACLSNSCNQNVKLLPELLT